MLFALHCWRVFFFQVDRFSNKYGTFFIITLQVLRCKICIFVRHMAFRHRPIRNSCWSHRIVRQIGKFVMGEPNSCISVLFPYFFFTNQNMGFNQDAMWHDATSLIFGNTVVTCMISAPKILY